VRRSLGIKVVTRQQHSDSHQGAKITLAQLVELSDGLLGVFDPPQFQIRFGKKIKVLWPTGMDFHFLFQLLDIKLGLLLGSKVSPLVQISEKVLEREG